MQSIFSKLNNIIDYFGKKKSLTIFFLIIYIFSYFLHNFLFIDFKVSAENPIMNTNIVVVLVDDRIYNDIKDEIEWYAKDYIQGNLDNTKTLVLSLNVDGSDGSLKTTDIVKILENVYFDGIKGKTSSLKGLVLVGDIPLPVVNNRGFIYPSIYPYVDFEDQQFIYDKNLDYFVFNNNFSAQAELWHGIINFEDVNSYRDFFEKLKKYKTDPANFVSKKIWYDDFVALKKYFSEETLQAYMNNFVYVDDVANRSFTNSMLNLLKGNYDEQVDSVINGLDLGQADNADDFTDSVKDYSEQINKLSSEFNNTNDVTTTPTLALRSIIKGFFKGYDSLIGTNYLSIMRDNVDTSARWYYKNNEGKIYSAMDSHYSKIEQKDSWIKNDFDTKTISLLSEFNTLLEKAVDQKIDDEKYYMKIPVPVSYSYKEYKNNSLSDGLPKFLPLVNWCDTVANDEYDNFYFGKKASSLISAKQFSIYRGSFRNLEYSDFSGLTFDDIQNSPIPLTFSGNNVFLQSIGATKGLFSTQIEANKGYDINSMRNDYFVYSGNKIHINMTTKGCKERYIPFLHIDLLCKLYEYESDEDSDFESTGDFSIRSWGGASTINLDQELLKRNIYKLKSYDYRYAWKGIYDMGGAQKIQYPEYEANSFLGMSKYASLIKVRDKNGLLKYPKYLDGKLQPAGKILLPYSDVEFFSVYNKSEDRGVLHNLLSKEIYIDDNNEYFSKKRNSLSSLNGKCGSKFYKQKIYHYKLIDSRLKNNSFNREELEGELHGDYDIGGSIYSSYNAILLSIKNISSFGITDNSLKGIDDGAVLDMKNIKSFIDNVDSNINSLLNYNFSSDMSTDEINSQVDFVENIITESKVDWLHDKANSVNSYLLSLYGSVESISLDNIRDLIYNLDYSDKFLPSWISKLKSETLLLEDNFNNFENLYKTYVYSAFENIEPIDDYKKELKDKISDINALITSGSKNVGCSEGSKFKGLCDSILDLMDDEIPYFQSEIYDKKGTGDVDSEITSFYIMDKDDWKLVDIFDELDDSFKDVGKYLDDEIDNLLSDIDDIDVISDLNEVKYTDGMNLITKDRPIDSVKFITFQGVGGDLVKFIYPDLYQVEVFDEKNGKLYLKSKLQIEDAIKDYLQKIIGNYNQQLLEQRIKEKTFYNEKGSESFDFLKTVDVLADPNRSYGNFDENYLVDLLGDKNIAMLAELLYYQNLPWSVRNSENNILKNLEDIRLGFDINQKISYVVKTYLSENNDQGNIITPSYNKTGYEIAYINSDGKDFVSIGEIPELISNIQSYISEFSSIQDSEIKSVSQSLKDVNSLGQEIDSVCNIGENGSVPLSKWFDAFGCWLRETLKNPLELKIHFDDAVGNFTSGDNFLDNILYNSTENFGGDLSGEISNYIDNVNTFSDEIKAMNTDSYNNNVIASVSSDDAISLQDILSYTNFDVNVSNSNIDEFSGSISIQSTRDLGFLNLFISVVGNNCLSISNISDNLCEDPYILNSNFYDNSVNIPLLLKDKISGSSVVILKVCLPNRQDACVKKSKKINILPSSLDKIKINSVSDMIMIGSKLPLFIRGYDKYNNKISQMLDEYQITTDGGYLLSNEGMKSATLKFNNFDDANINLIASNKPGFVHLNIGPTKNSNTNVLASKIISVVQPVLSIDFDGRNISGGDQINYKLPDTLKNIRYVDDNGIKQINESGLIKFTISLNTKNDIPLFSSASISVKNGLIEPGYIYNRQVNLNSGGSVIQKIFSKKNIFSIDKGKLDVYFYPSFVAGEDKITIKIQGLNPINIPIVIKAGNPKIVNFKIDFDTINVDSEIGGTIELRDIWENIVKENTKVVVNSIGSALVNNNSKESIIVKNGFFSGITIQGIEPGGISYIYAFIDTGIVSLTGQKIGYQELMVQKEILPKDKLNVMYLNLFGNDWGNQWGYFSDNDKKVNKIIKNSSKLLAVTTELINPDNLKQVKFVVDKHGQIKNFGGDDVFFDINGDNFEYIFGDFVVGSFDQNFNIYFPDVNEKLSDIENRFVDIKKNIFSDNQSSIFYFPELNDSIITGNKIIDKSLFINGKLVLSFDEKYKDPLLKIILSKQKIDKYLLWNLEYDGKLIGKMIVWTNTKTFIDGKIVSNNVFQIKNTDYDVGFSFAGSSSNNNFGVAIYKNGVSFPKIVSYNSIEKSLDPKKYIGFRSDFKNITLFGDGKSVGDATIPFGSNFLVNFGDPLLKRIDGNIKLDNTDFDGGLGKEIFSSSDKSIFKVLSIDFNNDSLKDLLVVYTDGTVKIAKNYGGKDVPYKLLQNLMVIVGGIKDIQIGDVDGNGYQDILVWTKNNQLRAYQNNRGIFDVDGKLVCLNTSVFQNEITDNPGDISDVYQVFFDYMDENITDKDRVLDIITNDSNGDIKIFYGGSKNGHANYLSDLPYSCDANWYDREKENIKLVKSYGIKLQNKIVQDSSLVHWYGLDKDDFSNSNNDSLLGDVMDTSEPDLGMDEDNFDFNKLMDGIQGTFNDHMFASKNLPVNEIVNQSSVGLFRYIQNPFDFAPLYETFSGANEIDYISVEYLSGDDKLSIIKKYDDLNGGVLKSGDNVKVDIYIEALDDVQATFIDRILGPWIIEKNNKGELSGFQVVRNDGNPNLSLKWSLTNNDGYLYTVDNMVLDRGDKIILSYILKYKQKQFIKISVEDKKIKNSVCDTNQCLSDEILFDKDNYNDIVVKPMDACMKFMQVFVNEYTENGDSKSYNEYFVDLAKKLIDYQKSLEIQMDESMQEFQDGLSNSMEQGMGGGNFDIPGDVFETNWDSIGIFSGINLKDLLLGGTIDLGNIKLDIFGGKISEIQDKLQGVLDGMCQGFKIGGKNTCQGLPIPFNMDLISPGNFNIMGCPIKPAFPGLPVFHFPGTAYVPAPILVPWGLKMPKPIDNFIWAPGGIFPSMIRIYVSPTLTMQLGVSICIGPSAIGDNMPPFIGDVGGNCIVTTIPLCKGGDNNIYESDQIIDSDMLDMADIGVCNKPSHPSVNRIKPVDGYLDYDPLSIHSSYSLDGVEILNSPFQLVSVGNNSIYPTPVVPNGSYVGGFIEFDTKPVLITNTDIQKNMIELKAGPEIKNKILGGKMKGLAKCVVQDWLDKQIKYTMNNLTKMTIGITLPDTNDLLGGLDVLANIDGAGIENLGDGASYCDTDDSYYECILNQITDEDKKAGYIQSIDRNVNFGSNDDVFEKASILSENKLLQTQQLTNLSQTLSNPFDALLQMFKNVRLVKLSTKTVSVKIPMIYGEDIGKYSDYLRTWLEINQRVLGQWQDLFVSTIGRCGTEERIEGTNMPSKDEVQKNLSAYLDKALQNIKNSSKYNLEKKQLQVSLLNNNLSDAQRKDIENKIEIIDMNLRKMDVCAKVLDTSSVSSFMDFQVRTEKLISSIKNNIRILEEYKTFPFKLYKWIHVEDKYLSEISSVSAGFFGTITTWLQANAERFASYVDSMVTLMDSVKTWQVLIDLSANRSAKCGKCSVDTYDQYSCKLSFLCPSFSVIPIPPFKIPNIFIDLSHIKLGMNILLPKLNFVPIRIDLPELPNLPSPPSYNFDLDMSTQKKFGINFASNFNVNFGNINIPSIPILPEPPELPELPNFLPSVDMKLPVLPPAPEIPALSPKIEGLISVADWVGKVFCILKGGIGLVAENAVKSKVEQLSQRTYNVPIFDSFDLTLQQKETPLKGFDYKIDSYVAMEYNFDWVAEFIDGLVDVVNSVSTNVGQVSQSFINKGGNIIDNTANSGSLLLKSKIDDYQDNVSGFVNDKMNTVKDRGMLNKVKDIYDYEQKLKDRSQSAVEKLEDLPQDKIDEMKNWTKDEFDQYKKDQLESYFPQTKFTYVDYKIARDGLLQSLLFMKKYIQNNDDIKNRIAFIDSSLREDNEVKSNLDGVKKIQKKVNIIVNKKRKEIQNLSEMIEKDYDSFLDFVDKNSIHLVSDTDGETTEFNVSLFTMKDSTKQILSNQDSPIQSSLKFAEHEIDGYLNALKNNSATSLNMSSSEHKKTYNYLNNLKLEIDSTLPLFDSSNNILLADNPRNTDNSDVCISCVGNNSDDSNNSDIGSLDLAQYIKGIFVPSIDGNDKINVVNSENIVSNIKDNYDYYDINNDGVSDILMWDKKSVYVKYGLDNDDYGGPVSRGDSHYYFWHISALSDLYDLLGDDGYKTISYMNIKLWDDNWEVKNFIMNGQNFDNISLAWKNNSFMGDSFSGYLIELNNRVDTFYDKEQKYFDKDSSYKNKKYVLLLPKGVESYTGWYIDLNEGRGMIDDLLTGTIIKVKKYNEYSSNINLILTDLSRAWWYARISTLKNNSFRNGRLLSVNSPWSNQLVVGRQIMSDTKPPEPLITLERVATNKILSTGNIHEGYVATNYNLNVLWNDNVSVKNMRIEYNGENILTGNSFAKTGYLSLKNLFFTGEENLEFVFGAEDVNQNIDEEKVKLNIKVPDISIIDVKSLSQDTRVIVSKLSHDIDSGMVVLQKERDLGWENLSGTNESFYGGYFVGVGDTIVTGGVYDFGYKIGIYDMNGIKVGTLDPIDGEIKILSDYISVIDIRMDFSSHLPRVEIFDKRNNNILFWISLPMEKLISVDMKQGIQNYKLIDLDSDKYGEFDGGKAILQDNNIVLYVSADGKIYVPSSFNLNLKGNYEFDNDNNLVKYIVQDKFKKNIAVLTLKTKSFITYK